jgi:hypothetical protein
MARDLSRLERRKLERAAAGPRAEGVCLRRRIGQNFQQQELLWRLKK